MANNLMEAGSSTAHADITAIERFIFDNEITHDVLSSGLALVALFVLLGLCLFYASWRRWMFRHLKWIAGSVFVMGVVLVFL